MVSTKSGEGQRASLAYAELQGARLREAQLQGASLVEAHLEGASLDQGHLQGASLDQAHLEGASLDGAQLQGASLDGAQLQGASLISAELQGASLNGAELLGAWLPFAQLQGAALHQAQLQGAWLVGAAVNATNFSDAFLWRTNWGNMDPAQLGAVRLGTVTWNPAWRPTKVYYPYNWDDDVYARLRGSMNIVPEGTMRNQALERIETLDCGNPDKTLASCVSAAAPPPEVLDWQKKLKAASVEDAAYKKALATELRSLVCVNDANAIYTLRGLIKSGRLAETGREVPALVDFIMGKDCPVSTSLTADDKAKVFAIKQDAEKNFPPPPVPEK